MSHNRKHMFILMMMKLRNIRYHFNWIVKRLSTLNNSQNGKTDVSICIIGNGSEGNPRSLFLNYRDNIFMFNCDEGIQRFVTESGYKSLKIKALFTTSNQWNNISGLSSLLLSRYDAGSREFCIYNRFINEPLINHCTMFDTKLKRIQLKYIDSNNFQHENLSIKAIHMDFDDIKSIVYLGQLSPEKGKINLEKCFRLKVPRNLVPELEKGQTVTNQLGEQISPSQVCVADHPEQNFIILECLKPKEYFDRLLSNKTIKDFLPKCEVVVHFTKDNLLSSKVCQDFIEEYSNAHHFLITESNPSFSLYSTHRFQTQLNHLDSKLFPMLKNNSENKNMKSSKNLHYSPTGIKYIFRSSNNPELSSTISLEQVPQPPTFEEALLYKDGSKREGIEDCVKELKSKQASIPNSNKPTYPEFIFLGTASSFSQPIRNVPSILVNLDEEHSLLMDCGENTYGQLLNFYGVAQIGQVLERIKMIFLSHHHSDHHLGVVRLLAKHQKFCDQERKSNQIWVICPPMVQQFLNSNIIRGTRLRNHHLIVNKYFESFKSKLLKALNVKQLELIPVNHCAYAYGITITDQSNFKFVYSGDTQPCKSLIERGLGCNLLIHEATVEDKLVRFARQMFHSTMSEAIQVGIEMQAEFTILTHFSQRYGKLPYIIPNGNGSNGTHKIGIAFDNMRLNPRLLERIEYLYEPLKCMYAKHLDKLMHRSEMYSRKYNNKITTNF